ncbi:hypothetical protein HHI36_017565 [Cryptolaemus montrouzieri]|uniref:Uncharacterized protein n=1 Tax=Cryptolaemus montrouzieri TaxID=559131 RepID=A0ABD2NN99_9CUCU
MKICKNMFLSMLGLRERSVIEWVTNPTVHGMPRTRDEKKETIEHIEDNKSKTSMISSINSISKLPSHTVGMLQANYICKKISRTTEVYKRHKNIVENKEYLPCPSVLLWTHLQI